MKVLLIGDIFENPGASGAGLFLSGGQRQIDIVIGNGENAAPGLASRRSG